MSQFTIWELIGALFILAGLFRLLTPGWVRKKKIAILQMMTAICKNFKTSTIRIVGLILIVIGILLIYYL